MHFMLMRYRSQTLIDACQTRNITCTCILFHKMYAHFRYEIHILNPNSYIFGTIVSSLSTSICLYNEQMHSVLNSIITDPFNYRHV